MFFLCRFENRPGKAALVALKGWCCYYACRKTALALLKGRVLFDGPVRKPRANLNIVSYFVVPNAMRRSIH